MIGITNAQKGGTTLAGYGITDAYTKAQTDTLLGGKADKATTLAGYGITDGVTTNTAQTITAEKTFTQPIRLLSNYTDPILEITSNYPRIVGHNPNNLSSADGMYFQQIGYDASQINRYQMDGFRRGSASQTELHTYIRNNSNQLVDNGLFITDSNEGWMTAPYRTYNSANVNDVVTIGSLAANPNVVHTTGNETVDGEKTFNNGLFTKGDFNARNDRPTVFHFQDLTFRNGSGEGLAIIRFQEDTNGGRTVYLGIWNHSTNDYQFTMLGTVAW